MSQDAFDDASSASSFPWASSSDEATSGEDAGENSDTPLHVSRMGKWLRHLAFALWMFFPAATTYGEYYNTPPYHEISWSPFFIGVTLFALGLGFVCWYMTHTYQVRVYPDRIEQRSYFWPGLKNPIPSWQGFCTLPYSNLSRVHIGLFTNFYRARATNAALSIPNGASDRTALVGTLMETLPDDVEITGDEEILDRIAHCYREGEELSRWHW